MTARSEVMVSRTLYQIAVVTLIASLLWVGMGVYQATKSEVDVGVDKEMLTPVNPKIDTEIVSKWSSRDTQIGAENVTIEEVQIATESGGGIDELVN